jgi:hypothetical protein
VGGIKSDSRNGQKAGGRAPGEPPQPHPVSKCCNSHPSYMHAHCWPVKGHRQRWRRPGTAGVESVGWAPGSTAAHVRCARSPTPGTVTLGSYPQPGQCSAPGALKPEGGPPGRARGATLALRDRSRLQMAPMNQARPCIRGRVMQAVNTQMRRRGRSPERWPLPRAPGAAAAHELVAAGRLGRRARGAQERRAPYRQAPGRCRLRERMGG